MLDAIMFLFWDPGKIYVKDTWIKKKNIVSDNLIALFFWPWAIFFGGHKLMACDKMIYSFVSVFKNVFHTFRQCFVCDISQWSLSWVLNGFELPSLDWSPCIEVQLCCVCQGMLVKASSCSGSEESFPPRNKLRQVAREVLDSTLSEIKETLL